jgi:hypothetical protein
MAPSAAIKPAPVTGKGMPDLEKLAIERAKAAHELQKIMLQKEKSFLAIHKPKPETTKPERPEPGEEKPAPPADEKTFPPGCARSRSLTAKKPLKGYLH